MSKLDEDFDLAKSSILDEYGDDSEAELHGAKNADRIIGVALLFLCGVLYWQTFSFPATTWAPLGMAFWPRLLIGLLAIVGAVLVFRGHLEESRVSNLDWRGFAALAAAVVYVIVMEQVGFLIATPVFLFSSVVLLEPSFAIRRFVEAFLFAASGTVGGYLLFERFLNIGLPNGG